MNEEIKLTLSQEDFAHWISELMEVDTIRQLIKLDPTFVLELTVIGMEIWKILDKKARMQMVADTLMNANIKED